MKQKSKFSNEVKIQASKDYEDGKLSLKSIAKEIGANRETVRRWYLRYREHGCSAFEISNEYRIYSKDFKLSVVEEYTSGKYSMADLTAKHNIAYPS